MNHNDENQEYKNDIVQDAYFGAIWMLQSIRVLFLG